MKIRLIALFLVVVYIMSSKGNARITNMLVNTEAEYEAVTTSKNPDSIKTRIETDLDNGY